MAAGLMLPLLLPAALAFSLEGLTPRSAPVARARLAMTHFSQKHTPRAINEQSMIEPVEHHFLDRTAKVVATLGPASSTPEMLSKLIKSGVDVFRLNSSHRREGQFEALIPQIRSRAKEAGRDVRILGDIQGPKFRCSLTVNDEPVPLEPGAMVTFALATSDEDLTRAGRIVLTKTTEQTALVNGLEVGMKLLLDDGLMEIEVVSRESPESVTCTVIIGGQLKSRKGINVPQLREADTIRTNRLERLCAIAERFTTSVI